MIKYLRVKLFNDTPEYMEASIYSEDLSWKIKEKVFYKSANDYKFSLGAIEKVLCPNDFSYFLNDFAKSSSDIEMCWKIDKNNNIFKVDNTAYIPSAIAIGELDEEGNDGPDIPWINPIELRAGEWLGDGETPWSTHHAKISPETPAQHYSSEIYWEKEGRVQKMSNQELLDWIINNQENPEAQNFLKELGGFDMANAATRPKLVPYMESESRYPLQKGYSWLASLNENISKHAGATHNGYKVLHPEPHRNYQMDNEELTRYLVSHPEDLRTREALGFYDYSGNAEKVLRAIRDYWKKQLEKEEAEKSSSSWRDDEDDWDFYQKNLTMDLYN